MMPELEVVDEGEVLRRDQHIGRNTFVDFHRRVFIE